MSPLTPAGDLWAFNSFPHLQTTFCYFPVPVQFLGKDHEKNKHYRGLALTLNKSQHLQFHACRRTYHKVGLNTFCGMCICLMAAKLLPVKNMHKTAGVRSLGQEFERFSPYPLHHLPHNGTHNLCPERLSAHGFMCVQHQMPVESNITKHE